MVSFMALDSAVFGNTRRLSVSVQVDGEEDANGDKTFPGPIFMTLTGYGDICLRGSITRNAEPVDSVSAEMLLDDAPCDPSVRSMTISVSATEDAHCLINALEYAVKKLRTMMGYEDHLDPTPVLGRDVEAPPLWFTKAEEIDG